MKKLFSILALCLFFIPLVGCSAKPELHVLNWGDYMDPDLIKQFEDEFNVRVIYRQVGSNEEMATQLQAAQNTYDIVIPSEYMIDKLIDLGLIQTIDFDQLENKAGLTVFPELLALYDGTGIAPYVIPYTWGTVGIMYKKGNSALKSLIESKGWGALFEDSNTYDVGMYDSARDAVAVSLMYKGFNVNSEIESELLAAEQALIDGNFSWGEDSLRGFVISGVLDMAVVYSGDYFSEYYYAVEDDREITFDFFVPNTTNVWMDAMVIPTGSPNPELAYSFIDFFLRPEVALANSTWIGYAPCYQEIYDEMIKDSTYGYDLPSFNPYPEGSIREMYVYGSDWRSDRITQIRDNAIMSDGN